MRLLFSAVAAAGLLASHVAAAQSCARPVEKSAFDVTGLKSQLMVTAISCHEEDKYNAFVLRFRPDLVAQERVLSSYFGRTFGRRAQQEHDDYITNLANSQSQTGIKAGTAFCQQNLSLFDEVMALKNGGELPTFSSRKTLSQPVALTECAAAPASAVRTRTISATAPVTHKR